MADDNNKQEGSFNFLKDEFVQKYFALFKYEEVLSN
jgi:hypothetical protein